MSDSIKLYTRNDKEANKKVIDCVVNDGETYRMLKESIRKKFNLDISNYDEFPITNTRFSWRKVKRMLEAEDSSSFAQLLRAGIQVMVNEMYKNVQTTFEDWAHVVQSSKNEELYAPLHGITFPREVAQQEPYPEAMAAGLDIKLVNRKYGYMFSVTKELIEDDQTGQMRNQVAIMAEYLKQVLEVLCYGKLASVNNMKYADLTIRKSETKPSDEASYPYSATGLVGGGINRPATFQALSQAAIQEGINALKRMKNKLGLFMSVNPKRIIISPRYQFDISVLLNSAFYPSGAAPTGQVGGAFAINPLQGILQPTISPFLFDHTGKVTGDSKAWYLVDDSKPFFVVQIREAAYVEQENPQSGESFERDIIRFKGYTRCNADFIDPRFVWQGSDGSV